MSLYITYGEIKQRVQDQLDLEDEVFIDASEMLQYCQDAIKKCEAKIHTLYEDYFADKVALTLVAGQNEYDLPSTIYADKIRRVVFREGQTIYPVLKFKNFHQFERIEHAENYDTNGQYRYWLRNAPTGKKMVMVPNIRQGSPGELCNVYFLRRAIRPTVDSDLVDIPEFYSFIVAYMKMQCYAKEGHPNYQLAAAEVDDETKEMENTLSNRVPDDENEIPLDLSFYADMNVDMEY